MATPPPIGTVAAGELLVDAQTRTLWLGVAATLDPAEAILISDIIDLETQLSTLNTDLRAYVDQQILTRSQVGHVHAIGDVTGLTQALNDANASVPAFCVIAFTGPLTAIPIGFHLCDGSSYVSGGVTYHLLDLRDKFIIGAGTTYNVGQAGGVTGQQTLTSTQDGAHSHTGLTEARALTTAQMPAHQHSINQNLHSHSITDVQHAHAVTVLQGTGPQDSSLAEPHGVPLQTLAGQVVATDYRYTGITTTQGAYANISMNNAGSSEAHDHVIKVQAAHSHQVTIPAQLPPFYALAFIMKLP